MVRSGLNKASSIPLEGIFSNGNWGRGGASFPLFLTLEEVLISGFRPWKGECSFFSCSWLGLAAFFCDVFVELDVGRARGAPAVIHLHASEGEGLPGLWFFKPVV